MKHFFWFSIKKFFSRRTIGKLRSEKCKTFSYSRLASLEHHTSSYVMKNLILKLYWISLSLATDWKRSCVRCSVLESVDANGDEYFHRWYWLVDIVIASCWIYWKISHFLSDSESRHRWLLCDSRLPTSDRAVGCNWDLVSRRYGMQVRDLFPGKWCGVNRKKCII